MKKWEGVPPYPGESQSQRVCVCVCVWGGVIATFLIFDILSRHFERYLHTMKLKLTEHV